MFVITHPYTSKNYSIFYNKAIVIYDTDTKVFHKFDPVTQTYVKPKASECKGNYAVRFNDLTTTISELVTGNYHNYICYAKGFSTLEEATLAKLHLLSELSAEIAKDLAYLQSKYAEACPPSLPAAYNTLKLNYPEIFI